MVGLTAGPASAYLLGQIQTMVETRYLGRVMSLVAFSAVGVAPVALAVFGALAEVVPVPALAAGCGLLMLPAVPSCAAQPRTEGSSGCECSAVGCRV